MNILVAEDDITSRMMLESILGQWSHKVSSVADGGAAWNILQSPDRPLLAILDWDMPIIDGVELCRRIKELNCDIPVFTILLTGKGEQDDILRGFEAGADEYITKPFDTNELRARINVAVRLLEAQQNLQRKVAELENALEHVKTLQGIIPICMHCHSIRTDDEAWNQLETYIANHSDAQLSHSICPSCLKKYYPDIDLDKAFDDDTDLS